MSAPPTAMTDPDATKSWYREPMMWLVVAIPVSALVMGAILLVVSIVSYDGLVADDYYRRGLEINRVLERDRAAATLGLAGDLEVPAAGAPIVLLLSAGEAFLPPDSLRLRLHHATRAGHDREVELVRIDAATYQGPRPDLPAGRWHLELEGGEWRLTGVLYAPDGRYAALRHQVD